MSKSNDFKRELTDFFKQYKKSKLRLVDRIADEFKGSESVVMNHLYRKYAPGVSYNGLFASHAASLPQEQESEEQEEQVQLESQVQDNSADEQLHEEDSEKEEDSKSQ
jgi:hypothetical protein